MNFKIEIKVLNIINYPSIERHFEDMGRQGWLIHKIIGDYIFIYKRIDPEELDFSISPYEIETPFTRRTKYESKEFQSVCESVGWNYASKSSDFHIYFKEKDSQALELETDDEEKLNSLEKIGKKRIIGEYFSLFIFIIPILLIFSGFITCIDIVKSSLLQVIIIFLLMLIISSISQIISFKKFINTNRDNIKLGRDLDHSESNFYFEKTLYISSIILISIYILDKLYRGLVLKDYRALFSSLPILIGISLATTDRIFIKPLNIRKTYKIIIFILTLLLIIGINNKYISSMERSLVSKKSLDINKYRVLSDDKFEDKENFSKNSSLVIPESYGYFYFNQDKKEYIETEYSNVLNEGLAGTLVDLYINQAKNQAKQYKGDLEMAVEDDNYYFIEEIYSEAPEDDLEYFPPEKTFKEVGLSLEDFNKLDKSKIRRAVENAIEIIKDKAISRDKDNLWNLDEVYFLNYDKSEIVLRDGNEVFYLRGKDFSDPELVRLVKDRLNLE